MVAADQLSSLTISTDDSVAAISSGDAWRRPRPAFDPAILHYSVGCNNTDTMTLNLSPAEGTSRISIDGIQYPNPGADTPLTATVPVTGDSVVHIALTNAQGAQTQYAVHCLADGFQKITVEKPLGEAEVLDEFIVTPDTYRVMVVDSNGVPRVNLPLGRIRETYARFFPDVNGEPRYSYSANRTYIAHILDGDLNQVEVVRSLPPLTRQDFHDFRVLENGNYMLMAYQDTERDLSHLTFNDPADQPYGVDVYVEDSVIQIVTPGPNARATFNWNSWDHMPLEDCSQHFFPPSNGDYAHLNAIQKVDDIIIASMRGCSRVLAIDATTGDVVWRVGPSNLSDAEWAERDIGPAPLEIVGDPEQHFCGQHASSLLPSGNLILFDNGTGCLVNPWTRQLFSRVSDEYSRGVEYAIDLENGEAVFVRDHSLGGTRSELGYRSGHIEELSNGHWLISWGDKHRRRDTPPAPSDTMTQVDPNTGEEWLKIDTGRAGMRGTIMRPEYLAKDPVPLGASFSVTSHTSVFHSGVGDTPQVVVAFNQPVDDFAASSPSLSVRGATVTSVAPHLVAGEPANTYVLTLAPSGADSITVGLIADKSCAEGGICTAGGAMLSEVPSELLISAPVSVSFSAASYSVRERESIEVRVELDDAHGGSVQIEVPVIATAGSASADEFSGAGPVRFAAGETANTVSLDAADDDLVEGHETFELSFDTLPAGVLAGSTASASVTITDADAAAWDTGVASYQVAEGDTASLTIAITNGVTFVGDQNVSLAVTGTASETDDFVLADALGGPLSAPYSVTLDSGAASVVAQLTAVDDSDVETSETVHVTARLASTNALIWSRTVTIPANDSDAAPVTVASGGAVIEGADAVFTLRRSGTAVTPLSEPLTVRVSVTAVGGVLDGVPPATVTFPADAGTVELRAATLDDLVVEDPAAVTALVRADNASPRSYEPGSPNSATVTVDDDDVASFAVTAGASEVLEGDSVSVTITLSRVTFSEPQVLTVSVAGTATVADDFVVQDADGTVPSFPHQLTLEAGADSVVLEVVAQTDTVEDDTESVVVSVMHDGGLVGSASITLVDPNELPMVAGGREFRYVENGTASVATFTATDAEGDSVTWSLAGDDAAPFDIDPHSGELMFSAPPDFEMPADTDADNVYEIIVEASDSESTSAHEVAVTVADVDEPVTITSDSGSFAASYVEHDTAAVASFTAEDPERATIRWSLGGIDGARFEISGQGVLSFVRLPDFEHPADDDADNEYLVQVRARAGASEPVTADVAVDVANADEPGAAVLSSPQPQTDTPLVAEVADPDGVPTVQSWTWQRSLDRVIWNTVTGASSDSYTPDPADEGHYLQAEAAYHDTTGNRTAVIESVYPTRAAPAAPNSAPSFSAATASRTVAENSAPGTAVGAPVQASDSDPGDASRLAYTLSGTDAALFSIDTRTGLIRVGAGAVFDFETPVRTYSVTVTAADPSRASDDIAVTVNISEVNEPPDAADDTAATAEDASVTIGVLANDTDPEGDALRVALRVAPLHGRVRVQSDKSLRYTPRSDFNGTDVFTYAASDGRLSSEAVVVVTVNPVNDQPRFARTSTTRSVPDNSPAGTPVGPPVVAADTDGDALAYRLFEIDAPLFDIDPDTGQITVAADTVIDRQTQSTYRLRVEAEDPDGARVSTAVTVTVGAAVTTRGTIGSGSSGGSGGGSDFDVGVATFVVANGWSPADVGVASVLAARTDGAVVLYTAADELSAETAMLMREASPAEVIIVGGTAAVSRQVLTQIRAATPDSAISRITGADRADTAARTARSVLGDSAQAGRVTFIVANGWSPPDIGAAAALAARSGRSAVIYTRADMLPEASAALLRDYQTARVILIGGNAAISQAAQDAIAAAAREASISRLMGADRVDTAAHTATRVLGSPAAAPDGLTLVIANGWSPPDVGVAAALAAAVENSAVAYTTRRALPDATSALIRDYRPTQVIIVGGRTAISDDVRAAITDTAPAGASVRRITGSTRTDTAARAARRTLANH